MLDLSAVEQHALCSHGALVERWGWQVSQSASAAFHLSRIPLVCGVPLGALDLKLYLHQLFECGGDAGGTAPPPGVMRVVRSKACRGAIMFKTPLTRQQCVDLVSQLAETQLPFCCAHGRPTTAPLVDVRVLNSLLARLRPQDPDQGQGWQTVAGREIASECGGEGDGDHVTAGLTVSRLSAFVARGFHKV